MTTPKNKVTKPVDGFEFLNPLDGKTYTLPPFDKTLVVRRVNEFKDTIPAVPTLYEALSSGDPDAYEKALNASQRRLGWLRTMTIIDTLDAHIPDSDDPAKAAIIANVNLQDLPFLYDLWRRWTDGFAEEVEIQVGED